MGGKSETRQERRQREREQQKTGYVNPMDPRNFRMPTRRPVLPMILSLFIGMGLALVASNLYESKHKQAPSMATKKKVVHVPDFSLRGKSYGNILELAAAEVPAADFAELNLLCGSNLNGTKDIDIEGCLNRLDQLVEMVKSETARNWGRWQRDPAEYENSLAFYKMGMLITVVRKDYKACYNPALIMPPTVQNNRDDSFYNNASDIFLQGLLSDRKMGTCSSMPVLYVAIARRLGYPVHLVSAKGHLFCRWDDGKERMNFEGTGEGIRTDPDSKYMEWPFKISQQELSHSTYLKNLNPQQELAIFLSLRADCLIANGRNAEALTALSQALNLVELNGGLSGIIEHFALRPVIPDIVFRRKLEYHNHHLNPVMTSNTPYIPASPIPPDPTPQLPNPYLTPPIPQPQFLQNTIKR